MLTKEILGAVDSVSNEKGVSKEVICDAIEVALATATKRRRRDDAEFRVSIDWESGDYETFRTWTVVDPAEIDEEEDPFNADAQLTPDDAKEKDPSLGIGDIWEEPAESVAFGRIVAQTARQVILQKVREAEREQVIQEYLPKVGELVSGIVKKTSRDSVVADLGNNAEAVLLREHLIPRETFRIGDRLRAFLLEVRPDARGPQIILTRTSSNAYRTI